MRLDLAGGAGAGPFDLDGVLTGPASDRAAAWRAMFGTDRADPVGADRGESVDPGGRGRS
jgi:hypothetical protein